ncbi:MAG TPA: hypothetical protein VFY54_17035, partial [Rubrobacter sp.]|nr:hypothetical protein [Rubrobacter sp.]
AALSPGIADNHDVHWDVIRRFVNSVEFDSLPMDIRQRVLTHAEMTQEAMNKLPTPEPQAPRTTLQIKATTGPSGVSKLLRSGGVDLSPEEAAEPPVETWVSDKIDEPDADVAGNDPLTEDELNLYKLKLADKKELQAEEDLRGAAAKADLAEKKFRQSDFRPKPSKTSVKRG